jgi:hypothetical protein
MLSKMPNEKQGASRYLEVGRFCPYLSSRFLLACTNRTSKVPVKGWSPGVATPGRNGRSNGKDMM